MPGRMFRQCLKIETAMAFLYFKKQKCDLVVLETGLGGETDATNVIKNTVCAVFATISVDHLGVIGQYPGRDRTDEIRDHQNRDVR